MAAGDGASHGASDGVRYLTRSRQDGAGLGAATLQPQQLRAGGPRGGSLVRPVTRAFRMAYVSTLTLHDKEGQALKTPAEIYLTGSCG